MDERALLIRYKKTGNLESLGALYTPYMSLLYGVCYKYLQDRDRSEDAVMQIFEELIDKLRHHEVDNFKSWLYVYARNYCLMQLRRDKKQNTVSMEDHISDAEAKLADSDPLSWEEQDFEKLEVCLAGLADEQQQCVRLFYLERKCYKDIVEETGYPLSKVKSYIQNGKRNLKLCMEKRDGK